MPQGRVYYSAEAEAVARRERTVMTVVFLALGLGIGAVLALLFAPGAGSSTRQKISEALDEGYRRGRDATNDALKQLEPEFPDLRKKVDELVDKIKK